MAIDLGQSIDVFKNRHIKVHVGHADEPHGVLSLINKKTFQNRFGMILAAFLTIGIMGGLHPLRNLTGHPA